MAFQRWLPGQHAQERALPRAVQPQHQHLALLQLLQRRLLVVLVLGLRGTGKAVASFTLLALPEGVLKATKRPSLPSNR